MSNPVADQKQLLLIRQLLLTLEKVARELHEIQAQQNNSVQPGSSFPESKDGFAATSLPPLAEIRESEGVADISTLEALLLKRVAFFEKRFFPEKQNTPTGPARLLQRSMLILKQMQELLAGYKSSAVSGQTQQAEGGDEVSAPLHSSGSERDITLSPLHPASHTQPLPLSFAQQRLWFLEQLHPEKSLYNEYVAIRLTGPLRINILHKSFNEIIRRHEILRTTFRNTHGETYQNVLPWHPLALTVIDLQTTSIEERESSARQLAEADIEQPFDFINGPLLRIRLFQLSPDEYLLITILHHTIGDGWSMNIFYHEVSVLYRAYAAGEPSPLPPLPIQYADYALWQHQWLQGETLQEQFHYWERQLQDAPTHLNLPTDRPRPAMPTYEGAKQSLLLPLSLLQGLKSLSQGQHVTLFMTLLAAFYVLLMRYSGQQDILVGSTIANRPRRELENVIGFFANTLVLRADLSGNPDFLHLLERVREMTLQAYDHQHLPFEKLVAHVERKRDLSRHPLFQVAFVLQNFALETFELPEVNVRPQEFTKARAKFDLLMTLQEKKEGLLTTLEYNTDLFEATTIKRLLGHWQTLLEAITADAHTPIENIPLLIQAEQEQLLHDWNATGVDYGDFLPLHRLCEQQALRSPDAIALLYQEQQLTYAQLHQRADLLAGWLQQQQVGPDVLVGVWMQRSLDLVIALLAILKAGGAYVPLDPSSPAERLASMVADARLSLVLTQHTLLEQGAIPAPVRFCCLDTDWDSLHPATTTRRLPQMQPEHLAYVIYTSGSTGEPKGAMNTQEGIVNRLHWMQQAYQLSARDRVLQKTPFSFDVSVWEFFWPLLSGASLLLAEPGGHQDPHYLHTLIAERAVSTLHFVPSMLQAFLDAAGSRTSRTVRQVICSGEALSRQLQERFFSGWGQHCQLHNLYGPTEAAIDVTAWHCQPRSQESSVPIGAPIANTQVYVLDKQQQPVPIGVAGELWLGGVGLARGYLQRPGLTAEKFQPHPFGRQGQRLYRTGDLVRWRADGQLDYLGRLDQQVKLRGVRIELGEIEAVLSAHPCIAESVVLVQGDNLQEKRLLAYVVLEASCSEHGEFRREVRHFLQKKLPAYMVPAHIVVLKELPLTPNGKVDRRSLLTLSSIEEPGKELGSERGSLDPFTNIIMQVWRQVLQKDQIGLHDNFFELGGHSLLAIQVASRLHTLIKRAIPLRLLFEAPTIAEFAQRVQQHMQQERGLHFPALLPAPRQENTPLSYAQQRLWFLHQLDPFNVAYTMSGAVRLYGKMNRLALSEALHTIMQRHESLRTTFIPLRGEPVQHIVAEPMTCLRVLDLCGIPARQQEQAVTLLLQQEAEQPFNLVQGPLLRAWLWQIEEQEQILVFSMDHIISDGWSVNILIRELCTVYNALIDGTEAQLPPLSVQYADYALWQRQCLQGETIEKLLAYWTRQLSGATALELPTDRPRRAVLSSAGAEFSFAFPDSLAHSLHELSRQQGVTLFMTLLTAFQILLHRYTGQQDIVVGTDIANRMHPEVENIIGFFVNLLVLRTQLHPHDTFDEVLQRVSSMVLNAYAHQDLPFEKFVETVQLKRTGASQTPLVNVLFVMQQGDPASTLELRNLTAHPLPIDNHTAKFDLALFIVENRHMELHGRVNYRTDLFDQETIARLTQHFLNILEDVIISPHALLKSLNMYSQEEKERQAHEKVSLREMGRRTLHTVRRQALSRSDNERNEGILD